jgi:hypothetical protein
MGLEYILIMQEKSYRFFPNYFDHSEYLDYPLKYLGHLKKISFGFKERYVGYEFSGMCKKYGEGYMKKIIQLKKLNRHGVVVEFDGIEEIIE